MDELAQQCLCSQAPEGCSSYMFPLIMGNETSYKVLGQSATLTATEAMESGLVQNIFPSKELMPFAEKFCLELADKPSKSLELERRIVAKDLVDILKKVNAEECDECEKKWVCKESFSKIAEYLQSRNMKSAALTLR